MRQLDKKKEARWALIATAIIGIPMLLFAAYISNLYQGSENTFIYGIGIFLLLPAYVFSVFGNLVALIAMIILEPPWLFSLVFLARLAYVSICEKYFAKDPKDSLD